MGFEQILEAAKRQDLSQLKQALDKVCIDVWRSGIYDFSAAAQLASEKDLEKNIAAINFLIDHGANINYVALGAAFGGHRAYVEELLGRGANIHFMARGAAFGGHRVYAEELLGRGAHIEYAAMGAGQGGHRVYAEELLGRGANMNWTANGAAQGGHRAYAEELIGRGANIKWVAAGAAQGRHLSNDNVKNQISYLSFFRPDVIPKLIRALRDLSEPIDIGENTQKRIIAISKYMRQSNVSYACAFTRTDPHCEGMLFLLMKIVMKKNFFSAIPLDIWTHVFSFVTPLKLSRQELTSLGFTMGRTYLAAQLLFYQSDSQSNHGERAKSFHEAVILANDKEALTQVVVEQSQDKEYKKAIENKTEDKFHRIIGFWKQEITGEDAELEKSNLILPKI